MSVVKGYFLERLREAREAREMSLEDLASIVGTSRQLVHKYEAAKAVPRPEMLGNLCQALQVAPSFFFAPRRSTRIGAPIFSRLSVEDDKQASVSCPTPNAVASTRR